MSGRAKGRGLLAAAGVVALAVTGSARAADDATTAQQLQEQIKALQAKVEQLEAKQGQQQKVVDTAAVDRAVDAVLKDAAGRSQLLAVEGFTAGYDNGKFLIQSGNGDFVMHPNFQFQPRYVTAFREDVKNGSGDNTDSGFEVRRMKFGVDGNVFGKDLTYFFLWATDRKSGNLVLEEAWARYQLTADWSVRLGQIKNPLSHEQLTSSKRLLAADRSLLNEFFIGGDDFVQAATVGYGAKEGKFQAELAFTDGNQSANTNFQDNISATGTAQTRPNYGVAGRAQYKVFGDWSAYDEFSALGVKNDTLVAGVGADYTETAGTRTLTYTGDVSYQSESGLAAYGEVIGRNVDPSNGFSRFEYGILGQVSYLVTPEIEPFARYDYMQFDKQTFPTAERSVHEITVGVNYYLHGHNAKFTLDATWLPNGSPASQDSIGVLVDSGNNEFVIRTQFQLLL